MTDRFTQEMPSSRICIGCGQKKPLPESFHRHSVGPWGYRTKCKECAIAQRMAWRRENRERALRQERAWAAKTAPQKRVRLRQRVTSKLGDACARCGFDDPRALQIDHLNGGGNQERKTHGWWGVYKRILAGDVEGFQLLCANCNLIKRIENKEHGGVRVKFGEPEVEGVG